MLAKETCAWDGCIRWYGREERWDIIGSSNETIETVSHLCVVLGLTFASRRSVTPGWEPE